MSEPLSILQDALHAISQAMLYPAIAVLLAMVGYALFSIGSVLFEYVRERRYFAVAIPQFLRSIKETPFDRMPQALGKSGLLVEQQQVLQTIFQNRDLDEEGLWALSKRLLLQEKERRGRVVSRNDAIAKLAPMVGLMGTLIPLGPGIVAFGRGDGSVMASAMLIAFDTTVTGLVAAAVMFVIARIRKRWYASYQASLEAGATTLLERIGKERELDAHPAAAPAYGQVELQAQMAAQVQPQVQVPQAVQTPAIGQVLPAAQARPVEQVQSRVQVQSSDWDQQAAQVQRAGQASLASQSQQPAYAQQPFATEGGQRAAQAAEGPQPTAWQGGWFTGVAHDRGGRRS